MLVTISACEICKSFKKKIILRYEKISYGTVSNRWNNGAFAIGIIDDCSTAERCANPKRKRLYITTDRELTIVKGTNLCLKYKNARRSSNGIVIIPDSFENNERRIVVVMRNNFSKEICLLKPVERARCSVVKRKNE